VTKCGRRSAVEGLRTPAGPRVEDVGVDHGGRDILVARELLDGADVVAVLEQVGGEASANVCAVTGLAMSALRAASRTARWIEVSINAACGGAASDGEVETSSRSDRGPSTSARCSGRSCTRDSLEDYRCSLAISAIISG
jgi:hypothetical protein